MSLNITDECTDDLLWTLYVLSKLKHIVYAASYVKLLLLSDYYILHYYDTACTVIVLTTVVEASKGSHNIL